METNRPTFTVCYHKGTSTLRVYEGWDDTWTDLIKLQTLETLEAARDWQADQQSRVLNLLNRHCDTCD